MWRGFSSFFSLAPLPSRACCPSLGTPILEHILGVTREWSWLLSPDPAFPHREGPGAKWGPLEPLFHHGGRVTDTPPKAPVAENLAPGTDTSCCGPVLSDAWIFSAHPQLPSSGPP